jgi:phage gp36-like protein
VPYITASQVRAVLARDPNRPGLPDVPSLDNTEIEAAVDSAAAEVAGRLLGRYAIPTVAQDVPVLIRDVTTDIAAYLLVLRYSRGPLAKDDVAVLRYQRALSLLELPGVDGSSASSGVGTVINPYEGQLFSLCDYNLGPAWPGGWNRGWRGW